MSTIQANSTGRQVSCIIILLVLCLISFTKLQAFAGDSSEKLNTKDRVALNATWDGLWISLSRGFVYAAEMHLKVDSMNNVQGYIKWTLKKSPRASEQTKIGLTGVEYVNGKYDPHCRLLSIYGKKKDDPHTIIGLDKYRLLLAENRKVLGGITKSHGTWRGMFSLGRRTEK